MDDVRVASRFRGFNLVNMFVGPGDARWPEMDIEGRGRFDRDDFRWIAEWGFNYVRLPLSYRWWASALRPEVIDLAGLQPVIDAVHWAHEVGLHVSVNLHHAPGYCINAPHEPEQASLWTSEAMLDCFRDHWRAIATALRDADALDFNLINEPSRCTAEQYGRVVNEAIDAIRQVSPHRLITLDGLDAGTTPSPSIGHSGIIHSCRGYFPSELTHHRAWWAGNSEIPPGWPQQTAGGEQVGDKELFKAYEPWRKFSTHGAGVVCGEFGCHNQTPHHVVLRWMKSLLATLSQSKIGWAMWNLRGSFGIIDSARADVDDVEWHGKRLDGAMLELLRRFL